MRVAPLALTTLAAFTLHEAAQAAEKPIPTDGPDTSNHRTDPADLEAIAPAPAVAAIAAPETQSAPPPQSAEKPVPTAMDTSPSAALAPPPPPTPRLANAGSAETQGIPIPAVLEPETTVEPTPSDTPSVTERSPAEAAPADGVSQTAPADTGFVSPAAATISYGDPIALAPDDPLAAPDAGLYHIRVDPTLVVDPDVRIEQTPDEYAAEIRACMAARPELYRLREVNGERVLVPVLFDGQPGTIIRDANGRLVCPAMQARASRPSPR